MNLLDKFLVSTYERVAFKSYTLAKFAKADKFFRKILAIEPDRVGTNYNLGMVNYAMGEYSEAEKYVLKERAGLGDTYEICRALGDIYWYRKNRENALRFFTKAMEKAETEADKELMSKKAELCRDDKSFKDALFAVHVFEQADRMMADKKYEEAENLYQQGLENDPTNFFALNNLGVIAMNIRMDYDLAESFFRKGEKIGNFKLINDNLEKLEKLRKKTGR